MAELSPQAQAVLDAIVFLPLSDRSATMEGAAAAAAAAALRAAADQVDWSWEPAEQLLSLAAELDNNATH
jgi:hypothetical protein